ncbi:MAG: signal peptidase I [Phycisphaerales bacterium]|nr:signal peptidase I [Phycisphaerales bacterium]
MTVDTGENSERVAVHPADEPAIARQVIESFEIVLTAMILAFVFRAFFVEAFIIPTGSMAPSLVGVHGSQLCPFCGWQYDYGPIGATGPLPDATRCPNCRLRYPTRPQEQKAGDRILVHKWLYDLPGMAPRRWDVIVFRDPTDPQQNFIKRLVGLPGEQIEIIDGDVFVRRPGEADVSICRKTATAQSALWFPVFDQGYLSSEPNDRTESPWKCDAEEPKWTGMTTRQVRFSGDSGAPGELTFEPRDLAQLRDNYGYNDGNTGAAPGDMRIVADVEFQDGVGWLGLELTREEDVFVARVHRDGRVVVARSTNGGPESVIGQADCGRLSRFRVEFAHVDWRVSLSINERERVATTDAQYAPKLEWLRDHIRLAPIRPTLIACDLELTLHRLRIDRDVHYTRDSPGRTRRATPGAPFALGKDDFFVLGDNSPRSSDAREWTEVGPHLINDLRAGRYTLGTVRRDQIVGRAFFVYLPGLLPADRGLPPMLDVGRARVIR